MFKTNPLSQMRNIFVSYLFLFTIISLLSASWCFGYYEVSDFMADNSMPLPSGMEVIAVTPAAAPTISTDPTLANPFGFGSAASGGTTLSLSIGISELAAQADLYVGIQSDLIGPDIFLFSDNTLYPLSSGWIKWQENTTGAITTPLWPDISLPAGTYTFYFLMTPAGQFNASRIWTTALVIGGTGPTKPDSEMEREIRQNIDLIFGITSVFSGGLTELTTIFSDKNVVTTSPEKIDLATLTAGTPITITVNFGSGYTMASGSVMSGNAQIVVSNIIFSSQGMGADFSGTFNDIRKDDVQFVNGQITGKLLLSEGASEITDISGQINFNNFSLTGQNLTCAVQLSGSMEKLNLSSLKESVGTIRVTFSEFTMGAYVINSGFADIMIPGDGNIKIITALQTNQGSVNLDMLISTMSDGAITISTNAPGDVGPYTVVIDNVILNTTICANYPAGGTIKFTEKSTGKTEIVTFTASCDGSHGYSEQ